MKNTCLILCLWLLKFGICNAQYVIEDRQELETLKKLPLEKIYIHTSSNLLFPGEYMYYSLYCLNALTNKLSTISKVAYVELVGENNVSFYKQKILLQQGRGQGDFFIPVTFPSGNYKLVAYTHWMRNAGISQFYQEDIVIINPYQLDQGNLISGNKELIALPKNKLSENETLSEDFIQLQTEKDTYGKREKVSLTPRNYKGPLGYGNYSISVRYKNNLSVDAPKNAISFSRNFISSAKTISKKVNDTIFLPEQRGELVYGNISDSVDNPVKNETVVISIPGNEFQLKAAITDEFGNFYTYINKPYYTSMILAQTLETNEAAQKIFLMDKPPIEYDSIEFKSYWLTKDIKSDILKRSVHNQIENAFYSVKPDSIVSRTTTDPFDGGVPDLVKLDEFTRFSTLRETLVELVPNVWVKRMDNGKYSFRVREKLEKYETEFESDPPLVLVDGAFVPDHNSILDFNARLIDKIKILRDPLVLGGSKYMGMVAIETIEGDYIHRKQKSNMAVKELKLPTSIKNYFNQSYASDNANRFKNVPDFRSQLYWNPAIEVNQNSNDIKYEFYTSDLVGEYEITFEGFTTYGKPISLKTSIFIN